MKSSSFTIGLALALAVSAAGAASAQGVQRPDRRAAAQSDSGFRRGPGARGQRGAGGMLLKGINLTDSQKARLKELRASEQKEFGKMGGRGRAGAVQGQKPDAATIAARRAEMEKFRDQRIASIRSILDAQQRTQFDKNVAEMKAHGPRQGRAHGEHGEKNGQR